MTGSMKSRGTRMLLAALVVLAGIAPYACAKGKRLSEPYSYTVGDDIAMRMAGFFRVVAGLEASIQVYYDRKTQHIVADVVGSASDVEGAKRELESFTAAVRGYVSAYAKTQHGIDLSDQEVTLVYHYDGGEGPPYEVVRREDGVYKVPPAPVGEPKE